MGIFNLDLNNNNFDDTNFEEDDIETIIHVRLRAWPNRLKQHRVCKQIKANN